jgi:hypothetical protein
MEDEDEEEEGEEEEENSYDTHKGLHGFVAFCLAFRLSWSFAPFLFTEMLRA